jgi:hypothetical protein
MKSRMKPLAVAIAVALASSAAHAAVTNVLPTAPSGEPAPTGIVVSIYDTANNFSEIVNTGNLFADATPAATGGFSPNSTVPPYVLAANPTGAAGQVEQLNFGIVPSFTTLFSTADIANGSVNYFATGGNGSAGNSILISDQTAPVGLSNAAITGVNGTSIPNTFAAWHTANPGANPNIDSTGVVDQNNANYTTNWGPTLGGKLGSVNTNAAVGTALGFYQLTKAGSFGTSKATVAQVGNATGPGFWYLSTSGDLTWNVPAAASAVPLPAAVWLLLSGLTGLGVVSRRSRVA